MRNVGNLGYIWSSSILSRSGYAHYLSFNYAGIGPQSYNHRAYGFQLRCLQEHPRGVLLAIRRRKAQLSRAERHPRRHPQRKAGAARHPKTPASRRQRGEQRAPTSSAPRPGWRRLARPQRVAISLLTNQLPGPSPKKLLRRHPTPPNGLCPRALGDSFYFAECEIVESLLRRGARILCKPFFVRALAGILFKANHALNRFPTPAVARGSSYPDKLELASGRPGRPYAGRAVPPGTRYGPSGREKPTKSHRMGHSAEKIPAKWEKFFPRNFGPNRISTAVPKTVDSSRLYKFPATPIRNVFFF